MKTTIARERPKVSEGWMDCLIGEFLHTPSDMLHIDTIIDMLIVSFTAFDQSDISGMLDSFIYNPFGG